MGMHWVEKHHASPHSNSFSPHWGFHVLPEAAVSQSRPLLTSHSNPCHSSFKFFTLFFIQKFLDSAQHFGGGCYSSAREGEEGGLEGYPQLSLASLKQE